MSNPKTYCAYSTLTHTYIMHTQLYIYIYIYNTLFSILLQ